MDPTAAGYFSQISKAQIAEALTEAGLADLAPGALKMKKGDAAALAEQEMCVNDLAMVLGMTQSAVSHQLKLLKMENQVKSRREGKNIYYSLDDQHVVEILEAALCHVQHKLKERK